MFPRFNPASELCTHDKGQQRHGNASQLSFRALERRVVSVHSADVGECGDRRRKHCDYRSTPPLRLGREKPDSFPWRSVRPVNGNAEDGYTIVEWMWRTAHASL